MSSFCAIHMNNSSSAGSIKPRTGGASGTCKRRRFGLFNLCLLKVSLRSTLGSTLGSTGFDTTTGSRGTSGASGTVTFGVEGSASESSSIKDSRDGGPWSTDSWAAGTDTAVTGTTGTTGATGTTGTTGSGVRVEVLLFAGRVASSSSKSNMAWCQSVASNETGRWEEQWIWMSCANEKNLEIDGENRCRWKVCSMSVARWKSWHCLDGKSQKSSH